MSSRDLPRGGRGRRLLVSLLLVVAGLALVAGALAARPALVLGYSGKSLGYSVARNTGGVSSIDGDSCRKRARRWVCDVSSNGSGGLTYRVRANARGCWTARRVGEDGVEGPRNASGCIDVRDYLRLWQRTLG